MSGGSLKSIDFIEHGFATVRKNTNRVFGSILILVSVCSIDDGLDLVQFYACGTQRLWVGLTRMDVQGLTLETHAKVAQPFNRR